MDCENPTLVGEENETPFIVRTLGLKGGRFGGIPRRLEKGTSANEDAGPRRGVDCENPTLVGEENETSFIRLWKPFPADAF